MKHVLKITGPVILIVLLANWGTPNGDKTAYFGEVTTRQGNVLKLTNIKIGRDRHYAINKQIPVYEKPKEHAKPVQISGSNNQEIVLTIEPETQLFRKFIDLSEIKEVSIPEPEVMWTFKKEKHYGKQEYIEVIISQPGATERYLIDRRVKLYGDAIHDDQAESSTGFPLKGPEETEVPLPGIKKVTLEGYYLKQENGTVTQMPACSTALPATE